MYQFRNNCWHFIK